MDSTDFLLWSIIIGCIATVFITFLYVYTLDKAGFDPETFSIDGNSASDIARMDCDSLVYNYDHCIEIANVGRGSYFDRCYEAYGPYIEARCGGNSDG